MSNVESGSELKVYFNSSLIGIVTSFTYEVDYARRTIMGIDILHASEITTGPIKVKCMMNVVALKGDGGASGWGLTVQAPANSLEKYNTISVLNRSTDEVIFKSDFTLLNNQSWSIKSRTIVSGVLSFMCLDFLDGSGASTLLDDAQNLLNATAS